MNSLDSELIQILVGLLLTQLVGVSAITRARARISIILYCMLHACNSPSELLLEEGNVDLELLRSLSWWTCSLGFSVWQYWLLWTTWKVVYIFLEKKIA